MAAQSPLPEDGEDRPGDAHQAARGGGLLGHGAGLVRATALDLAVLAGHVLLYPTGILPERAPAEIRRNADWSPAPDTPGPGDAVRPPRPAAGPGAPAPAADAADAQDMQDAQDATAYEPGCLPAGRPAHAPAHRPVLLIHGFVDNRSAFTFLRRSLQHHGWDCVQSVNYSPLTSDIRHAAAQLGPRIDGIRARTGHDAVDIVAHSLGGLIARHYVQCQGGDAAVRTLVTLGTPHAGTRAVPALTPHPLARQMRPGSPVLRELAEPAAGCRTRFVAFWSDLDQLMIPAVAARLEHPDLTVTNIQVSGVGHLALPVHGAVVAHVRRELAADAPGGGTSDAA